MKKSTIYVIYTVVLVDLFSVSMVVVTLPNYLKNELGMSATVAGMVGSLYGLVQFFSGPLIGGWSDIFGTKIVLLLCIILCVPSYACLAYMSWVLIVVARLSAGCCKHTQNLCRAFLAAHGDQAEQMVVGGRLNAMGNVGYMVGPAFSALLLQWWGYSAVYAAVCLAFCANAFVVYFYLPDDDVTFKQPGEKGELTTSPMEKKSLSTGRFAFLNTNHLVAVIKEIGQVDWSRHWDLFLSRFLLTSSVLLYRSSYNWLLTDRYQVPATEQSYLSSYQGLASFLVSMRAPSVSRWLGGYDDADGDLTLVSARFSLLMVASFVGLAMSRHFALYVLFLGLLCAATSVMRVVSVNATTARCNDGEYGVILGANGSLTSVARCLAPFFGGLLHDLHVDGTALVAILMTIGAYLITTRFTLGLQPKLAVR